MMVCAEALVRNMDFFVQLQQNLVYSHSTRYACCYPSERKAKHSEIQ